MSTAASVRRITPRSLSKLRRRAYSSESRNLRGNVSRLLPRHALRPRNRR
jgi:hypothetical protein